MSEWVAKVEAEAPEELATLQARKRILEEELTDVIQDMKAINRLVRAIASSPRVTRTTNGRPRRKRKVTVSAETMAAYARAILSYVTVHGEPFTIQEVINNYRNYEEELKATQGPNAFAKLHEQGLIGKAGRRTATDHPNRAKRQHWRIMPSRQAKLEALANGTS